MPRGGKREGAGRPKGSKNSNATGRVTANKSITLLTCEWEKLMELGAKSTPSLSPQKYAQTVIREHLAQKDLAQ